MMKGILCFLLIVGLSAVLADPVSKNSKRGSLNYCYTSYGTYRHGDVFNTSPCVKYRCEYGRAREYQRGCRDAYGVCRSCKK